MGVGPNVVVPIDHVTPGVQAGLHSQHRRRPIRLPGVLVGPRPFDGNRPSWQGAGQQCRVKSRIVRPVVAVAARPFHVHHAHAIFRHPEHLGNRAPRGEDPLGVGPDGELAVYHLRHRR